MQTKSYHTILFDFDGTLVDSSEGIKEALYYSLTEAGVPTEGIDLNNFIGPPLAVGLKQILPIHYQTDTLLTQIKLTFRKYYDSESLFKTSLYPGIELLLQRLKQQHKKIAIATSKPGLLAEKILKHLNMDHYFDLLVGNDLAQSKHKPELIAEALAQLSITDTHQAVMVGDRMHDVVGAQKNNMDTIGVLYGFGSLSELSAHAPTYIAKNVIELQNILIN